MNMHWYSGARESSTVILRNSNGLTIAILSKLASGKWESRWNVNTFGEVVTQLFDTLEEAKAWTWAIKRMGA
jgi:hypothetical protein